MVDPSHKGKTYPAVSYTLSYNKLREFLIAIGDDNDAYLEEGAVVPPTMLTMLMFWGGGGLEGALNAIDVEIWNVLHGEQEYEYLAPIQIGDTLTSTTHIDDIYEKAGMTFVVFVSKYTNQHDEHVANERSLIIVREQSE